MKSSSVAGVATTALGRVVLRHGNYVHITQTELRLNFRRNLAQHLAGRLHFREEVLREAQLFEHGLIPLVGVGVEHLRSGGHGILRGLFPRQEIAE